MCFNSIKELLEGKFSCNEQPLLAPRTRVKPDNVLEPSPEGTVTKPDNLILVNPAVVYHPLKKKYYLYFKGNVYDPTWRGVHGVAIADAPEGPFIVQDDYVFEFETGDNQKLNAGKTIVSMLFLKISREDLQKVSRDWPSCMLKMVYIGNFLNILCL